MIQYFQDMWQLALEGKTQGVWFWVSVYSLLMGTYSLLMQLRTRTWPWVEGEIHAAQVDRFGIPANVRSDQQYQSSALYHYEVSGQSYEGKRVSPWVVVASHNARFILAKQLSGIERISETTAKVFYNPSNPQKSFLIVAGAAGIAVTVAFCLLPGVLFYFKFYG